MTTSQKEFNTTSPENLADTMQSEAELKPAITNKRIKKTGLKKFCKVLAIILAFLVGIFLAICTYFIATEYKPADIEKADTAGSATKNLQVGSDLSLLTWNIGFAGLSEEVDFFADGGEMVFTVTEQRMKENLEQIKETLIEQNADINLLQEIDLASNRTFGFAQTKYVAENLPQNMNSYAPNFKVKYLPYPWPPLGYMDSGIFTTSKYKISDAARYQLQIPFSWPESIFNLKRALLVTRLPVENSEKELVVINLHLEAYDDGEGKAAQSRQLVELFEAEAAKGNYVIAGGDFNQAFPGTIEKYGINPKLWAPPAMDKTIIESGMILVTDDSVATCRSLDKKYLSADLKNHQHYVIDGFIVSDNIAIKNVKTLDKGFKAADHNPVRIDVTLENE